MTNGRGFVDMNEPDAILPFLVPMAVVFIFVVIGMGLLLARMGNAAHASPGAQLARYPSLRRDFQLLAQQYSGKLLPGPMYELPKLAFDHLGSPVQVEASFFGSQPASVLKYHISVRFAWPDAALRMDVYPEGLVASLQKLIGVKDIEVGDRSFDQKYMITGNDAPRVQNVLTSEARELIKLIRGPRFDDDVHVRIVGGAMWISKRNLPGDYETLRDHLELALALYDTLLQQPRAGIEFLDSVNADVAVPTCQVCGEGIAQPEIQCTRCRTPHHRECWQYFGGCSVYGCRGQEFEQTGPGPLG